jgi:hypothetical protein
MTGEPAAESREPCGLGGAQTLATSLAREPGVPMRIANLTMDELTEAVTGGFVDQDSRPFLKLQLEHVGVEMAVDPPSASRPPSGGPAEPARRILLLPGRSASARAPRFRAPGRTARPGTPCAR